MFDVNVAIISEMRAFLHMARDQYELQQLFCADVSKDFSRNRKLGFERLILFITRLCKRTLSLELERFFEALSAASSPAEPPPPPAPATLLPCSVSAYSQQRKKLHPCFFRLWNEVLCTSFYHYSAAYGRQVKRWHGLRVVAADGSSAALVSHPALQAHFSGQANQQGEFCVARTFYYYDVLNQITVDALIIPYRTGELAVARNRADTLADDSVTLYDRNFCNYRLMALHLWAEREKAFLIRAKEKQRFVAEFMKGGSDDEVITLLPPTADTIAKMRESGLVVQADTGIRIRLVRVPLPGGGTEVLATNLMAADGYSAGELRELYFLRWGVETAISFQKNILMLECFSGLSVVSVEQDFYATVVLANLQMCLMKDAQDDLDGQGPQRGGKADAGGRRYGVQVNRNKAACRVKDYLLELFTGPSALEVLGKLYQLFIRDVLPVRKGRNFARKRKNRRLNSKHRTFTNYKIN